MSEQDKTKNALRRLIAEHGVDMAAVSKAIGKNHAYIQQYLTRGVPAELSYKTALSLADFFGCGMETFGMRGAGARPSNDLGKNRHPVQAIRRLVGLNASQFARALGEKEADIHNIENGVSPLTERLMLKICSTFQIDPAEFAGFSPALTADERVMLLRIRSLKPAQRRALDALFKKFEKDRA